MANEATLNTSRDGTRPPSGWRKASSALGADMAGPWRGFAQRSQPPETGMRYDLFSVAITRCLLTTYDLRPSCCLRLRCVRALNNTSIVPVKTGTQGCFRGLVQFDRSISGSPSPRGRQTKGAACRRREGAEACIEGRAAGSMRPLSCVCRAAHCLLLPLPLPLTRSAPYRTASFT